MRLSLKNLKQASVETASGIKLGYVVDIILELDGQLVAQYEVKHSIISGKTYLISREQIVRFEYNPSTSLRVNKIIVDDNTVKTESKEEEKRPAINPGSVSIRETN